MFWFGVFRLPCLHCGLQMYKSYSDVGGGNWPDLALVGRVRPQDDADDAGLHSSAPQPVTELSAGWERKSSRLFCAILRATVVHSAMQTHTWIDLTVLWIEFCLTGPISQCLDSFLHMYYVYHCILHMQDCNMVRWTWWDWRLSLGLLLPSVLWHCRLGHLTYKNPSPIWPIMCLVGR